MTATPISTTSKAMQLFLRSSIALLFLAICGCSPNKPVASPSPSASQITDPPAAGEKFPVVSETPEEDVSPPDAISTDIVSPDDVQLPAEIVTDAVATSDTLPIPTESKQFVIDWPKPYLTLVLTGRQHGYIEPCGCTGLANQKGGLSRRHRLVRELTEKKGWAVAPLDVGNQVRRVGRQAEIKFHTAIRGMKQIGYKGLTFGPDDLRLTFNEILADAADPDVPFVSANVDMLELVKKYRIIEADGHKIGVTAILGTEELKRVGSLTNEGVELSAPAEAIRTVLPQIKAAGCDVIVLLAHASSAESMQLAKQFPEFDFVVTAGGAGEPAFQPIKVDGSEGVVVQVGTKGMYVGLIGLYENNEKPWRYRRVELDARFEDSKEMLQVLADYQQQLKDVVLDSGYEGLGIRPQPHPSDRKYVGTETCAECHTTANEIWESTAHAHATESLVHPPERYEVPRHFDPECLACHVTGWNTKRYTPYASGYLSLEATPLMHNVGCENCHGPGSAHVAAENGDATDAELKRFQEQMRLPLEEAFDTCIKCHDLDNSPDFHKKYADGEPTAFERYWKEIIHEGVD